MCIIKYVKGHAMSLSKNFNSSEFMCKGSGCCSTGLIDQKLVKILQQIRDHFGQPVTINSAYRCAEHNKKVGGSAGSYHTKGQAADIKVKNTAPAEVAKYAESIGVLGIGLYETDADGYFVHIDTRKKKSFWYGQKQDKRDTFGGAVEKAVESVEVSLPVLKVGDEGAPVKALQYLLICNEISVGKAGADGIFGAATFAALRIFQSKNKLPVTGTACGETWACLLTK